MKFVLILLAFGGANTAPTVVDNFRLCRPVVPQQARLKL